MGMHGTRRGQDPCDDGPGARPNLLPSETRCLPSRQRIGLVLEDISSTRTVEIRDVERPGQAKQHELRGFIDASPQLHRDGPEVRHLERDGSLESRIDLRRRHVNGDADSREAAPSLDETHDVVRDLDAL